MRIAAAVALALAGATSALAQQPAPQVIPVEVLQRAPEVDGNLAEWGTSGWSRIPVAPAVKASERASLGLDLQDHNAAGSITVEMKAGVVAGRLYFAVRWPDDGADTDFRLWERRGSDYAEGRQRDDAFAFRFAMEGDFDRSMLSGKSYAVDVWLWSAGRSNPVGLAEDMMHRVSTRMIEDAAEYEVKGVGTVYIKKLRDAGTPLYRNVRPAPGASEARLPSIQWTQRPTGSVADVAAKGVWKNNAWTLEVARRLDTSNGDDVAFKPGSRVRFQIAVFNHSADENKSISEPLVLDLGNLRP